MCYSAVVGTAGKKREDREEEGEGGAIGGNEGVYRLGINRVCFQSPHSGSANPRRARELCDQMHLGYHLVLRRHALSVGLVRLVDAGGRRKGLTVLVHRLLEVRLGGEGPAGREW